MTTLKYPLAIENGGLRLASTEDERVAGAISSVIQTRKGERVLRNYYGSDLKPFDLVGDPEEIKLVTSLTLDESMGDYPDAAWAVLGATPNDSGMVAIDIIYNNKRLTVNNG